jgi:hypothetical protein
MTLNMVIKTVISAILDAKESHWARFCRFQNNFTLPFCFSNWNSVSVTMFQAENTLDRNQIRSSICLKKLQLQPFWQPFLACLHVQDHQQDHQQGRHQSQNPLLKKYQHKNYQHNINSGHFCGLGTPPGKICGGCQC